MIQYRGDSGVDTELCTQTVTVDPHRLPYLCLHSSQHQPVVMSHLGSPSPFEMTVARRYTLWPESSVSPEPLNLPCTPPRPQLGRLSAADFSFPRKPFTPRVSFGSRSGFCHSSSVLKLSQVAVSCLSFLCLLLNLTNGVLICGDPGPLRGWWGMGGTHPKCGAVATRLLGTFVPWGLFLLLRDEY